MTNPKLSKSVLYHKYIELGKTQKVIANETGVSQPLIQTLMKRYHIEPRSPGRQKSNIQNQRFGSLMVITETQGNDKKHPAWLCLCDCGNEYITCATPLLRGERINCPECSNKRMSNLMWRGYEEISGHFWGQIKCGAKIRNMDFQITREQVWNKFLKQNRKCALTGIELFFDRTDNTKITASLDRIDSSIGYLESNVQWVHKVINRMKSNMSDATFACWCKKVTDHSVRT